MNCSICGKDITYIHCEHSISEDYRYVEVGELLRSDDEFYTWINPQCTELGWIKMKYVPEKKRTPGLVLVRRKISSK